MHGGRESHEKSGSWVRKVGREWAMSIGGRGKNGIKQQLMPAVGRSTWSVKILVFIFCIYMQQREAFMPGKVSQACSESERNTMQMYLMQPVSSL